MPESSPSRSWIESLHEAVDARSQDLVQLRRHLHQHPEPSGSEVETSRHLHQLLQAEGVSAAVVASKRGVLVNSDDQSAERRYALRADIDALLMNDGKRVDYRSSVEGVMHACGHDAHTATVYGAVLALHQLAKQNLLPCPVTWRAIFQPAEETATGANEMVAAGAIADVDAIFSTHVDPTRPAGTIGVRAGSFTAACDAFHIDIEGVASHGARPHEAKDTIAAAAQLVSAFYQFVPRAIDSQDSAVIAITQIHGGTNGNVIPDRVAMDGMVRTHGSDVRTQALSQVAHLVKTVGDMTRTQIHLKFGVQIPGVENDPQLNKLLTNLAVELLGVDRVQTIERPSMGGEDFAYYLEHLPGVMFRLGSARDTSPASGLHTPLFDIDERCLAVGAKILAAAVIEHSLATNSSS